MAKRGITELVTKSIDIKWKEVAQDFAGIEIIPLQKSKQDFMSLSKQSQKIIKDAIPDISTSAVFWYNFWLNYWNQGCGCVWGKGGLTKCEWIEEIYNKSSLLIT